ncbi:hypothetical protein [Methylibium sp.]|jgi:hypothetical protein|uniref:hypothetical protein n=1 Tax=Methylibium sp. TaxID=2067992 RepID=UPI003D09EFA9
MQIVRQFTERLSRVKAAKRAQQQLAEPKTAPQALDAGQLRQISGGARVPAPKNTW